MDILVVIVNYRTPDLTERAVAASLAALAGMPSGRVCVVENGSGDDSLVRLRDAIVRNGWRDRVELIVSPENTGFGGGVNQAVRRALAEPNRPQYIYLLNSDARPAPDAITRLVEFLTAHSEVGIAGSYIHGPDGETHDTAFRFPTVASEFEGAIGIGTITKLLDRWIVSKPVPQEATRVDWLAGASMMIRREVFEAVGLFDENFFLYFEETDFCRRAAHSAFPTWYVPSSRVEHIGAASTGWKDFTKPRAAFWFYGRRWYFFKNHGRFYLWGSNLAWLLGFLIGEPRRRLVGRRGPFPPRFLRDFLRHNFGFRPLGRGMPRAGGTAPPEASARRPAS